ncbi:MAG: ATP-binding cassette domain-containing protein [Mariprofundaceae bacterium]|nr:ATP-binding cassette domain-containing protein [Mariprofundaceae bacterium]
MISMQKLMLRYPTGKTALAGVDLKVEQGGFVYLIGESGAGKSSVLRTLYGDIAPSYGELHVQGMDMRTITTANLRQLRQRIGIIFQDHKLIFSRTVFENVALPLRVQGRDLNRLLPRVKKVLEFVGLSEHLWSYPEALSGGEQQRVAIARAMSSNPPLILADEPTGNLDVVTARHILDLLQALNKHGTTVIIATHDIHLLQSHAGKIVQLHQGAVVDTKAS